MADDFYEDDEPIEELLAAFNRGPWAITGPPSPLTQTSAPTYIYDWTPERGFVLRGAP